MNTLHRESSLGELVLAQDDVMTADNAPLLLTRTARQTSVVVRYSRVERWDVVETGRRRRSRATVGARPKQLMYSAFGGIGVGTMIVMAFSGAPTVPVRIADASVAVSLPAAAVKPSTPAPVAAVRAPIQREQPAVSAASIVPVAVAAAVATPAAAVPTGPETEAAALAQAFSSNEAVSWRGAANFGTVVVGAATIENGKYCRDVAILTRSDNAADRTVNGRKCLEPGGRITDQPLATPQ